MLTDKQIRNCFHHTAARIAPDFLQAMDEMGEPPVVPREVVCDYIDCQGDENRRELCDLITQWVKEDKLDEMLDKAGVPKNWA